jgi:hypothetical protein
MDELVHKYFTKFKLFFMVVRVSSISNVLYLNRLIGALQCSIIVALVPLSSKSS